MLYVASLLDAQRLQASNALPPCTGCCTVGRHHQQATPGACAHAVGGASSREQPRAWTGSMWTGRGGRGRGGRGRGDDDKGAVNVRLVVLTVFTALFTVPDPGTLHQPHPARGAAADALICWCLCCTHFAAVP